MGKVREGDVEPVLDRNNGPDVAVVLGLVVDEVPAFICSQV